MMDVDNINRTHRQADIRRWQTMNFVVGYEIKQSNNPIKDCPICQRLSGKYPKEFLWDGWHDKCKCFCVPILMDEETFDEQELSDLKAALKGTEYKKLEAKNKESFIPENFIDWFLEARMQYNDENRPNFITNNIQLILSSYEHYKNKSK